jgi:hypothetical protein
VISIETYAGADVDSFTSIDKKSAINIGCAIALLRASSGYLDSTDALAEASRCDLWRETRVPITSNAALGTALLRWISSLSAHIKVLIPPPPPRSSSSSSSSSNTNISNEERKDAQGAASSSGHINLHRLERVEALAEALAALVQCLWSHSVPRGVQGILAVAAKACTEATVNIILSLNRHASHHGARGTHHQHDLHYAVEVRLHISVTSKLLHFAAIALKIIGSPSFSEKSLEVNKLRGQEYKAYLDIYHII